MNAGCYTTFCTDMEWVRTHQFNAKIVVKICCRCLFISEEHVDIFICATILPHSKFFNQIILYYLFKKKKYYKIARTLKLTFL